MKRTKQSIAMIVSAALCATGLALTFPTTATAATGNCGDTTIGMNLGPGADAYLDSPVYQSNMKATALALVRKWRQDALDTGVKWSDNVAFNKGAPSDGVPMRKYLASKGISEATYLNPQWSRALERTAIQRAVEEQLLFGHTRPSGQGGLPSTTNSQHRWSYEIASPGGIDKAFGLWANEKGVYVSYPATGTPDTGHYTSLVDPKIVSYGFGSTGATGTWDGYSMGEASTFADPDSTATSWTGSCEFRIGLLAANLKPTMTPASAVVGQSKPVIVTATSTGTVATGETLRQVNLKLVRGTITSANPVVATAASTTVTGRTAGTAGLSMASGDQTIPLGNFTVLARAISSVANPATVTTPSGTAPRLPATVVATWNDGATSNQAVTWGTVPTTWRNRAGGTFTVPGTVAGTSRTVTATVSVTPAVVKSSTQAKASTPAGIAPKLPTTVAVTWSNGDASTEPVNWDAVAPASYAKRGSSFTVAGTVAGKKVASALVTVTAPVVASVQQDLTYSVLATRPPVLPATVAVKWTDGTTTQESVTWSAIDPTWYDRPGTVTANGVVKLPDGSYATPQAKAVVTVRPIGFSPAEGMLPLATGLIGESTGDNLADIWAMDGKGQLDFYKYANKTLTKQGIRGEGLENISYMGAIPDQNGDQRADMFYRDSTDQSLWFAWNQGNGYLTKGIRIGANWGAMNQIWYAGTMVNGSPNQYLLARRSGDGTLWRYQVTSSGLKPGVQVGHGWDGMRVMASPGNMFGDAAWDVVGVRADGLLFGYEVRNGQLISRGEIGHGWNAMTSAFVPGDLTGDGRLDLIGQRSDGTLWAYANTKTGFATIGQIGTGFSQYKIMA